MGVKEVEDNGFSLACPTLSLMDLFENSLIIVSMKDIDISWYLIQNLRLQFLSLLKYVYAQLDPLDEAPRTSELEKYSVEYF